MVQTLFFTNTAAASFHCQKTSSNFYYFLCEAVFPPAPSEVDAVDEGPCPLRIHSEQAMQGFTACKIFVKGGLPIYCSFLRH